MLGIFQRRTVEAVREYRGRIALTLDDDEGACLTTAFPDERLSKDIALAHLRGKMPGFDKDIREAIETLVPELAESEDERIRTEIIAALEMGVETIESTIFPGAHYTVKEAIAWLEKQKEQKPVDDKEFEEWIDDWWKHNKVNNPDSYDKGDEIQFDKRGFKNFCREIRNMNSVQQPAEWSEEDIKIWKDITYYVLKEWNGIGQYLDNPALTEISMELQKRYGSVRKISQWDKKDEKTIHLACEFIQGRMSNPKDSINGIEYGELINRLKSIGSPFKEGINEEIKKALYDVNMVSCLFTNWKGEPKHTDKDGNLIVDIQTINTLIKANHVLRELYLRPVSKDSLYPHWKPSEEQMMYLAAAIEESGENPILDSLYKDLKRL